MQNIMYNNYNSNPEMLAAAQQYGLISSSDSQKPNQGQNTQAKNNTKQALKQQYQSIQSISEAPEREESSALHLDEDRFHSNRFQPVINKFQQQTNPIYESYQSQQYHQEQPNQMQNYQTNQSLNNKESNNQIQTTIDQVQELIRATQDRITSSERTSQRISVQTDGIFSEGGQSVEDRNSSKMSYQEIQKLNGLQFLNNKTNSNLQNQQIDSDKIIQQPRQLNYTGERIVYEEPPQAKDNMQQKKEIQNNYNNYTIADYDSKHNQPITELVLADKQEYIPLSMQIMQQINGRQENQQPKKQEKDIQKEQQSPIQKDQFNQQKLIEKQKQLVLKRYQEGIQKTQNQNKYFDYDAQSTEKQRVQSSNGSKQQKSPKNLQAQNNDQIRFGTSPNKNINSVANQGDIIDSAAESVNPKHVYLSLDQFQMKQLHNNNQLKTKNTALQPTKKPHSAGFTAINKESNTFMNKIQKTTGNNPTTLAKKGSSYQNGSSLDLIRKMMQQKDFKALEVPEENVQNYYQPQPNTRESMPTHLEGIEQESNEIKEKEIDSKQLNKMQNLNQEINPAQTVEGLKKDNVVKDTAVTIAPQNQSLKQPGSTGGKHHIQISQDSLIRSLEERKKFTFASNGEKCLIFTKESTPIISNLSAQTTKRAHSKDQTAQKDIPSQDQIIPYSEYYEDPMRQSEILLMEEQEAFQELEKQKGIDRLKVIEQTNNNVLKNEVSDSQYQSQQKSIMKQSNDSVNSQQGLQQLQSYQASEMHSPKNPDNYQNKQGQKLNYSLGIGGIAMYESGEHSQSNYQVRQSSDLKQQNHLQNSKSTQSFHNTNLIKPRTAEPKISKVNQHDPMIIGSISPQQNASSSQKDLRWLDYSTLERNSIWLQVRNQNRSNLQKQQQEKELAQCTFKPTINTLHNKRNNILPSGLGYNNDISAPFLNNTNTTLNITNNLTANNVSNSLQNYQQNYSPNNMLKNDRNILNQSKNLSISTNNQGQSYQHNYAQSANVPGNTFQAVNNNNNNSNNRSFSSNVNSATNRSALAQSSQQNRMNQSRDKSILQKSISPSQISMIGGQSSYSSPNSMNKRLQNTKSYSDINKLKRQQNINNKPPVKSVNILRSPGVFSSPTLLYPPQKIISSKMESNVLKMFAQRQAKFN